jgi:hypothetical protein
LFEERRRAGRTDSFDRHNQQICAAAHVQVKAPRRRRWPRNCRRMRPIPPGADHLAGVRIAGFTPMPMCPAAPRGRYPCGSAGAQRRNGRCSADDGELCGLAVFQVGPRGHSRSTSTPGAVVVGRPVVGPANVHLLPVHSDGTSCVLTVCTERLGGSGAADRLAHDAFGLATQAASGRPERRRTTGTFKLGRLNA